MERKHVSGLVALALAGCLAGGCGGEPAAGEVTPLYSSDLHGGGADRGFNRSGDILISDQFNNRVIEIDRAGDIVWHFGNGPTDLTARMTMGQGVPQANGQMAPEAVMDVEDVARAVVYMASLPLSANVQFMTVMATKMPYVGRG